MALSGQLARSLEHLDRHADEQVFAAGTLENILDRYLLQIEDAAADDLRTSILLVDRSGKHLVHGAAPSLPKAYCEAIDGIAIGPSVGSCGTAAFVGHAIFVTDIATDSLWADFRDLALSHELRSCWSTPIRGEDEQIIGTFAVYHRAPRAPGADEILAIKGISGHVARAIARWR